MSEIELSICIATRNRAAFLGATLDSIVAQLTDACEIVIVDGASSDETPQIAATYAARDPRIRIQRLAENGGVDRDYARSVALARGRYCWLFTDDDLMLPGAVDSVLGHMRSDPALILANAEVWDSSLSHCCDSNRLRMEADRHYAAGEDDALLRDAGRYLTFIGGVIIRRDLWEAREKEQYFGSLFIHFGVIFQSPLPAHAEVIARPLVRIRYGNAGWTQRAAEIWLFKWPALVWSMPRSDGAKAAVTPREPWRNPLTLAMHRAHGSYGPPQYDEWLKPRAAGSSRVIAAVIAALPWRPLNAMLRFLLTIIGYGRRTTAIDLRDAVKKAS